MPTESTVAADPSVLRMGSRIRITGLEERYNGVYVVADTGPKVRGRHVDLYVPNCRDAVRFGRRRAAVAVMPQVVQAFRPAGRPEGLHYFWK